MYRSAALLCLFLVACAPSGGRVPAPPSEMTAATATVPPATVAQSTTPSPTIVPTNQRTHTPEVAFGTREHPVPRGQSLLTPTGWEITVIDFIPDAWAIVQPASPSNEPPAAGNRMVMIRLRTTNVRAMGLHVLGAISFYLATSDNGWYSTYGAQSDCGIVPDKLAEEYFQGSSGEGNVCFEIPSNQSDFLLAYQYAKDQFVFFSVE